MRPSTLHRVTLEVPDVQVEVDFYRDVWGMHCVSQHEDVALMRSRDRAHADLALVKGERLGLHHVAMAIRPGETVDQYVEAALAAGGTAGTLSRDNRESRFGDARSATVRDTDGNQLMFVEPGAVPQDCASSPVAIGPRSIGHAVLWSADVPKAESFYQQLGFRVSDRTAVGMSFLRCNTDHHSIALAKSGGPTGLQHIAFDIGTLDNLMRAKVRLAERQVECFWGVGRHGPGNNIFSYYLDVAGVVIEFYAELDVVKDDDEQLEARFWDRTHGGDVWGVAGPAPAQFRG